MNFHTWAYTHTCVYTHIHIPALWYIQLTMHLNASTCTHTYCDFQKKWNNAPTGSSSKLVPKAVENRWNVPAILQVAVRFHTRTYTHTHTCLVIHPINHASQRKYMHTYILVRFHTRTYTHTYTHTYVVVLEHDHACTWTLRVHGILNPRPSFHVFFDLPLCCMHACVYICVCVCAFVFACACAWVVT